MTLLFSIPIFLSHPLRPLPPPVRAVHRPVLSAAARPSEEGRRCELGGVGWRTVGWSATWLDGDGVEAPEDATGL